MKTSSFDQALGIESKLVKDGTVLKSQPKGLASFFLGQQGATHVFYADDFIEWALKQGLATDERRAKEIGQSLLDHRRAHHVTDDFDFERGKQYALLAHESDQAKQLHSELGKLIQDSSKFSQGHLSWKQQNNSNNTWLDVYGVLRENNTLELYKRRSAASLPVFTMDGIDICEETTNCKPDWYCFTMHSTSTGKSTTVCADHSSKQEQWLQQLVDRGVRFQSSSSAAEQSSTHQSLFDFEARKLDSSQVVKLSKYQGRVCVVVNVASGCGLTARDYTELVQLHREFQPQGFEILGFPTNEFGSQEPGTEQEITRFAQDKFNVQFPLFGKTTVNGDSAHPVFQFLKSKLGGVFSNSIKWNFTKFLCDRDGLPVKRYAPTVAPSAMRNDIEMLLKQAVTRIK